MADERFACSRSISMPPTNSDSVFRLLLAISFKPSQKASSRLTLVLCPARMIERFTTVDFMAPSPLEFSKTPTNHCRDTPTSGRGDCWASISHRGMGQVIRGVSPPSSSATSDIVLRHAPILALAPFRLFIVDSLAQPLKGSLPPANLVFQITINITLDQFGPIRNVSSG